MDSCIAVDIGGTKMLIAEVRRDGSIVNKLRFPTGKLTKEQKVANLIRGVREYEAQIGWENGTRPGQMGIGINDVIDPVGGIWKHWDASEADVALKQRMEAEFGVCCHIDNDVKCTVIAENEFGQGKGCRDMVYVNIGTGLAAGAIAGGKLIRGSDGWAGEVGFMNLTGGEGIHVELLASGMGLTYQTRRLLEVYPDSVLRSKADATVYGQDVFAAADAYDPLACRILEELVKMNAVLISNLVCVLSPEIVIVGGGLVSDGRLLKRITGAVSPKAKQHLERGIVLTGLHPDYAGLMGAAAIGLGFQEKYF